MSELNFREMERRRALREIVITDMLTDLFASVREHGAFPFRTSIKHSLSDVSIPYRASTTAGMPDWYSFEREYPDCGEIQTSVEQTQHDIKEAAKLTGRTSLFSAMSYGVHNLSMKVDGRRTWPEAFVDVWADDYASRMTEAMYQDQDRLENHHEL